MTTLLIVEHFPATAAVIRTLLADSARLRIVGEAGDAAGALALLTRHRPDIVVLDGTLAHRDGQNLIRRLKEAHPTVRLLVLADYLDETYREATAAAGADRIILKVNLVKELLTALRDLTVTTALP